MNEGSTNVRMGASNDHDDTKRQVTPGKRYIVEGIHPNDPETVVQHVTSTALDAGDWAGELVSTGHRVSVRRASR